MNINLYVPTRADRLIVFDPDCPVPEFARSLQLAQREAESALLADKSLDIEQRERSAYRGALTRLLTLIRETAHSFAPIQQQHSVYRKKVDSAKAIKDDKDGAQVKRIFEHLKGAPSIALLEMAEKDAATLRMLAIYSEQEDVFAFKPAEISLIQERFTRSELGEEFEDYSNIASHFSAFKDFLDDLIDRYIAFAPLCENPADIEENEVLAISPAWEPLYRKAINAVHAG